MVRKMWLEEFQDGCHLDVETDQFLVVCRNVKFLEKNVGQRAENP